VTGSVTESLPSSTLYLTSPWVVVVNVTDTRPAALLDQTLVVVQCVMVHQELSQPAAVVWRWTWTLCGEVTTRQGCLRPPPWPVIADTTLRAWTVKDVDLSTMIDPGPELQLTTPIHVSVGYVYNHFSN